MKDQADVGQRVADLGALVKAETADYAVANPEAAQNFFKGSRLRAGTVENRDTGVGIFADDGGDLFADEFSFRDGIRRLEIAQRISGSERGLQILAEAVGIVFHDRGGGIENRLGRAVIFLEADEFGAWEILREALQISSAGAAPTVNRLVLIAYHADVPALAGKQPDQLFLRAIGVLKFVDHQVLELI